MDIRVLRYFVSAAQSHSISAASKNLFVTQPTLTRQFRELEEEIGHQLFERSKSGIKLTPKGQIFYERAVEILAMVSRLEEDMCTEEDVQGTVRLTVAEMSAMRQLAEAMAAVNKKYPQVRFDIQTATRACALQGLEDGSRDFALLVRKADPSAFNILELAGHDRWGMIMLQDDPLARKFCLGPDDVLSCKILMPCTEMQHLDFEGWLGYPVSRLHTVATYNLINNGLYLVEAGLGSMVVFENIVHALPSGMVFIPFSPGMETDAVLAWPKGRELSCQAQLFLKELRDRLSL